MLRFIKVWRVIIISVLIVSLAFILGYSYSQHKNTFVIKNNLPTDTAVIDSVTASTSVDMTTFWKVWKLLDEKYVPTGAKVATSTTIDQRILGAISGMTDSFGDPYTVFLPPEDTKQFEADISGNLEGVGMEIGIKDKVLSVISPIKGSPAEKAGIKAGDKIITIDGKPAAELSTDQAVKLIRGPSGTVVKISVLRNGNAKTLDFSIVRALIDIPSLATEIKGDVFVISLYNFYAPAREQFKGALKEFINSKKHKLIIDVRGNPGGYLDAAVDMASWFLPLGKTIVREDFGPDKTENVYRSKGYDIFNENLRMVILVDGGSASASEILAGALQEHGLAKLVGTKTYGKGSVQELISVGDGASLKVTVAKWLTPNWVSISDGGLTPDYEVKITEADSKAELDPQMDKAIELLR